MRRPLPDIRMSKCTAKIVWEWEEQCFASEYVWEFMRVVWRSMRVVERGSVRVVEVLWYKLLKVWELCDAVKIFSKLCDAVKIFSESCVRLFESFLLLVKYSLNTQNRQKHGHDQDMTRAQTCKTLKIESLRLGFTFSKPSLKDSIFKALYVASTWSTSGILPHQLVFYC